jgi:hypothetical protein
MSPTLNPATWWLIRQVLRLLSGYLFLHLLFVQWRGRWLTLLFSKRARWSLAVELRHEVRQGLVAFRGNFLKAAGGAAPSVHEIDKNLAQLWPGRSRWVRLWWARPIEQGDM